GTMISSGQFVARLVEHFGLLTEERLQGLTMIVRDLPVIERQPDDMATTPEAAKDAPVADENALVVLEPVQTP
nr:hypothetical protein [Tanacetum cinerariifolium]